METLRTMPKRNSKNCKKELDRNAGVEEYINK